MQGDGEGGNIRIDNDHSDGAAIVYLKLYKGDVGLASANVRSLRPEYQRRLPACVTNFSPTGLDLELSNSGRVASDLVMIDFEVVYCSFKGHGPADGFTVSHLKEDHSSAFDVLTSASFIPPLSSELHRIEFTPVDMTGITKIYFRARLSPLMGSPIPPDRKWDFLGDAAVTECCLLL